MRLPDIQLRGGKVLRFEVRFGEAAVSRRMPRGVPTCMLQVNLDNVSHASSCVLLCNLRRLARGSALRKPNLVLRLRAALCNLPIQPLWLCARLARGTLTSDLRVLQLRAQENSRVVYAFDDEVVSELRSAGAGALGAPPSGLGPAPGPALRV